MVSDGIRIAILSRENNDLIGANMNYWETAHVANGDEYADIVGTIDWGDPHCIENVAVLVNSVAPNRSVQDWIFEFVNSVDTASYLKQSHYRFTYSEAAWIVYQCRSKPLAEKICALATIATEMGCSVDEHRPWGPEWKEKFSSVAEALNCFLPEIVMAVEAFFTPKGHEIYQYCILSPEGEEYAPWEAAFSSFDYCMAQAKQDLIDEPSPKRIQIRKQVVDTWCEHGKAVFVDDVLVEIISGWENDDGMSDMEQFFESMWLTIPTPFVRGDVLYDPWCFKCKPLSGGGPIVVEEFAYERFKRHAPVGADSSDMSVMGYFQEEDGSIFYEVLPGYLNLERCPADLLTGQRGIMKDLGSYLKGDCYLDELVNRCAVALLDGVRQNFTPMFETLNALERGAC